MFPFTVRESALIGLASSLSFALTAACLPVDTFPSPISALVMLVLVVSVLFLCLSWAMGQPVDIWKSQRELMTISGQSVPAQPEVNHHVIGYLAFTLEEMAESIAPIRNTISDHRQHKAHHLELEQVLQLAQHDLHALSHRLRSALETEHQFHYRMSYENALEALDGMVDATVTIAGWPIAAGLPASLSYVEVQTSNLSKRDPNTGRIEKDPSGKWIKGPNFRKPRLDYILSSVMVNPHEFPQA